jgi:cytochrome c oxidase subunit 2
MTGSPPSAEGKEIAERAEARWANVSIGLVILIAVVAAYAGIAHHSMPQAHVERIDPRTLHLGGEFIESNLGSALEADGSVTVRLIGQQYSFIPQCILVPTHTKVTFRGTSADVVHGFIVSKSNVNTMLIPGYISVQTARFASPRDSLMPCHEFCGLGHEGMWAHVRVIDKSAFMKLASQRQRLTCNGQ